MIPILDFAPAGAWRCPWPWAASPAYWAWQRPASPFSMSLLVLRYAAAHGWAAACRPSSSAVPAFSSPGAAAVFVLVRYAAWVHAIDRDCNDDDIAYFAFVARLLDTGTLIEPFSLRRLAAGYGGSDLPAVADCRRRFRDQRHADGSRHCRRRLLRPCRGIIPRSPPGSLRLCPDPDGHRAVSRAQQRQPRYRIGHVPDPVPHFSHHRRSGRGQLGAPLVERDSHGGDGEPETAFWFRCSRDGRRILVFFAIVSAAVGLPSI